ncbi:hypothetical protein L6164_024125 [Bauhinia variegata]|uniref:Uncharacterized protein n=1 Tax=Bauhinia variegata TaxID=167791 RepID=A0ACB9LXY9_BAUVA|nr:hypothetical protein L6164_024125 [Bauhinia variegata]
MVRKFLSFFQVETKRLLWLIGLTFAVMIVFQYVELPYGNVWSSLFSTDKSPTAASSTLQTAYPPSESEIFDDLTILNEFNSTGGHTIDIASNTGNSEEKDAIPEDGSVMEQERESFRFDEEDGSSVRNTVQKSDNGSAMPMVREPKQRNFNINMDLNYLTNSSGEENITRSEHSSLSPSAITPIDSPPHINPPTNVNPNITTSDLSNNSNIVSKNSPISSAPEGKKGSYMPIPEVTTISEMNNLLLQSRASYRSMRPRWSSSVDQELLQVRSEIENAPIVNNDPSLYAPLYRNVSMFKRSYELMEETLKVYVYKEGARPILHNPFLRGLYASEGWFMKLMEGSKSFVTRDPKKAHLFYLPFSSRMLEETLYVRDSHSHRNLVQFLHNYVDLIAGKYRYWNRTGGTDHFLVACHDWAPSETRRRLDKCIKALCNADVKESFVFGKDVSLPETYVTNAQNPTRNLGGKPASKKSNLAFFAGNMHGYVRPVLLQHWQNKDPDMKIFGTLPKSKNNRNYVQYMKSSKYCICAKGYEVNSPRVVEAIFYECVPVIISDNFVPPFFEILNWESFAVFVLEKDIPNLKNILLSIPRKRYLQMQMRVKKVQQHFLWHTKPVKYDIFHMILHSIWYNRVFTLRAR